MVASTLPQAGAQAGVLSNVILVICDQFCYGLTKASGFPLDTTPTLDRLQSTGVGFERNYCMTPLCVLSRISMLTGRWPEAHHVRMNLQADAAFFEKDIYQVAKGRGYRTGLIGKNHTYLKPKDVDVWREYEQRAHVPQTLSLDDEEKLENSKSVLIYRGLQSTPSYWNCPAHGGRRF